MLPVGFFGQADSSVRRLVTEGCQNIKEIYVAVLHHKQRIREDPQKRGGSNKVNVFVIRIGMETIDRRNHIFGRTRCDGCSWGSPCLGVVAESLDSNLGVMSKLIRKE